jgi:hypothetical protein
MSMYRFAGVEYLLDVNPAFTECTDVKEEIDGNKVGWICSRCGILISRP